MLKRNQQHPNTKTSTAALCTLHSYLISNEKKIQEYFTMLMKLECKIVSTKLMKQTSSTDFCLLLLFVLFAKFLYVVIYFSNHINIHLIVFVK